MPQEFPTHQASKADRAQSQTAKLSRITEEHCREIINSLDSGFCVVELKFGKNGRALDYKFVAVNAAFERHTGIVDALGKWMRDLRPSHEQYWFDIYGM
jgi:PAS domain-containing protein